MPLNAVPARCIRNAEELRSGPIDVSRGVVTALNPYICYAAATSVAANALTSGRNIPSLVLERGLFTEAAIAEILKLVDTVRNDYWFIKPPESQYMQTLLVALHIKHGRIARAR